MLPDPFANAGQGFRRCQPLAGVHHRLQERFAGLRRVFQADAIAAEQAVGIVLPVDLLAARPGGLAGRALAPRRAGVFLQLVDHVQGWGIGGGVQARANAKAIIGRAGGQQRRDLFLIEIATAQNRHLTQAAGIENVPYPPRLFSQIAAVDAHALDGDAVLAQVRRQLHQGPRGGLGVVGVEQ